MYQVDLEGKRLIRLNEINFSSLNIKERYDIQEWIEKNPEILGEDLLIIAKELILTTGIRLDLLGLDKNSNLVIIELKRDESGNNVDWQAIKYASYCSNFTIENILRIYADYLNSTEDEAEIKIEEFINDENFEKINNNQRIILVSKEFHSDVASSVLWLRDFGIDIECLKLTPFMDQNRNLFITSDKIIPLPEAEDYIKKKETKQNEIRKNKTSSFSLEKTNLPDEDLEKLLKETLLKESDLIPKVIIFLRILLENDKKFQREELKQKLFENGVGIDIGQAGRYLSNISQFLTKKSTPHFRQIIEFETSGESGEVKNNYFVVKNYRVLLSNIVNSIMNNV